MARNVPHLITDTFRFLAKQASAAVFAIALLIAILLSAQLWQDSWAIARYDALLAYAIALQVIFIRTGIESWHEARVILLFHLTGTVMEIFKVNMGSWSYPGEALFMIWGVPLFSGFMYASVGSYIARTIRLFDLKFAPYPPFWITVVLAAAIYLNFFGHHFGPDIRYVLFGATVIVFWRTRIWMQIGPRRYWTPLPVAAFFASGLLWLAENIATGARIWLYYGQTPQDWVRLSKMGSWYLLLYVSFVLVTLIFREALLKEALPDQKQDQQGKNRDQVEGHAS